MLCVGEEKEEEEESAAKKRVIVGSKLNPLPTLIDASATILFFPLTALTLKTIGSCIVSLCSPFLIHPSLPPSQLEQAKAVAEIVGEMQKLMMGEKESHTFFASFVISDRDERTTPALHSALRLLARLLFAFPHHGLLPQVPYEPKLPTSKQQCAIQDAKADFLRFNTEIQVIVDSVVRLPFTVLPPKRPITCRQIHVLCHALPLDSTWFFAELLEQSYEEGNRDACAEMAVMVLLHELQHMNPAWYGKLNADAPTKPILAASLCGTDVIHALRQICQGTPPVPFLGPASPATVAAYAEAFWNRKPGEEKAEEKAEDDPVSRLLHLCCTALKSSEPPKDDILNKLIGECNKSVTAHVYRGLLGILAVHVAATIHPGGLGGVFRAVMKLRASSTSPSLATFIEHDSSYKTWCLLLIAQAVHSLGVGTGINEMEEIRVRAAAKKRKEKEKQGKDEDEEKEDDDESFSALFTRHHTFLHAWGLDINHVPDYFPLYIILLEWLRGFKTE